jgi:hypothetical protein
MILIEWPLMFCALVPVIVIETEVARRHLALPYPKAVAGAAKANILSAVVGVPLAWGIMLLIELVTMFPLSAAAEKWHWRFDSPVFYLVCVLSIAWTDPPVTSWWPTTRGLRDGTPTRRITGEAEQIIAAEDSGRYRFSIVDL